MRATMLALSNSSDESETMAGVSHTMVRICVLGTISVLPILILPTTVGTWKIAASAFGLLAMTQYKPFHPSIVPEAIRGLPRPTIRAWA